MSVLQMPVLSQKLYSLSSVEATRSKKVDWPRI